MNEISTKQLGSLMINDKIIDNPSAINVNFTKLEDNCNSISSNLKYSFQDCAISNLSCQLSANTSNWITLTNNNISAFFPPSEGNKVRDFIVNVVGNYSGFTLVPGIGVQVFYDREIDFGDLTYEKGVDINAYSFTEFSLNKFIVSKKMLANSESTSIG